MRAEHAAVIVPLEGIALRSDELETLIEIAYLAISVDRGIGDDELDAFRAVVARLRTLGTPRAAKTVYRTSPSHAPLRSLSDAECNALLDRLVAALEYVDVPRHLNERCERLSPDVRELAYKMVCALSLVDLDASPAEAEFASALASALELVDRRAAELEEEVLTTLNEGG